MQINSAVLRCSCDPGSKSGKSASPQQENWVWEVRSRQWKLTLADGPLRVHVGILIMLCSLLLQPLCKGTAAILHHSDSQTKNTAHQLPEGSESHHPAVFAPEVRRWGDT
uniref:Uncharacterized protein n=1 Tax=Eutreptiella gymnastica TaxID=73025 RepID=A0A7S4FEV5_9EUGL